MMWGYTDCRAVSEMLWNYTAHRLSEEEIERVERHIVSCGPCRAEAEAYRQTVDALSTMRRDSVPDSRRGWHELQARLATPERRTASPFNFWSVPTLAWGGAIAVAALAVVLVSPVGNRSGTAGEGSTNQLTFTPTPTSQDRAEVAESSAEPDEPELDAEELSNFANEGSFGRARATAPAAAKIRAGRHPARRSIQLAQAEATAGRRRAVSGFARPRTRRALDFARMDGRSANGSGDGGEYMLTPVSAVSEADSSENYVMGSVVMSGRSADAEVARRW